MKNQIAVLREILDRFEEKQYADVAPRFREAAVLASFGKEMLWLLFTNRRYWKYLNFPYVWNALRWTARIEARMILPSRLAKLCLKIAGYKQLPKGPSSSS